MPVLSHKLYYMTRRIIEQYIISGFEKTEEINEVYIATIFKSKNNNAYVNYSSVFKLHNSSMNCGRQN
jgi:hypothetical protein